MRERPEFVVVGRFGRPHGISGEIYLIPLSDNPDRFRESETFWMETDSGWSAFRFDSIRTMPGRKAVRMAGIENPEQARQLTNKLIYVKAAALGRPPDGAYFHFDLVGCRVLDSSGRLMGEVVEVETYPANDVWVVESETGKRYLFPAVKVFVKEVNIEKQHIVIDPPEGIFDSRDED